MAKKVTGKNLPPKLQVNDRGVVSVFHGGGIFSTSMNEACRALLVYGDLLAAAKAIIDGCDANAMPAAESEKRWIAFRAAVAKAEGK